MALPKRKHLTRLNHLFRLPVGEVYFVTAACANKRAIFSDARCAELAAKTFSVCTERHGYEVLLSCVMPTHFHAVIAARERSSSLSELVRGWKTWCARQLRALGVEGKVWQNEFFDHRIRSKTSLAAKCEYVVQNPVRAGLAERAEEWPHTGGTWWDAYLARGGAG